ncbi:MAG: hypothetical protein ACR2KZ_22640, partial [Segetibacter sp.]
MKEIFVKALFHRKKEQIGFYFERDHQLGRLIKTVPFMKWSQTNTCWYLPLDKSHFKKACSILLGAGAKMNTEAFESYLQKRKQVISADILLKKEQPASTGLTKAGLGKLVISFDNMKALKAMIKTLHLKAYSKNTIALYTSEMIVLLKLFV